MTEEPQPDQHATRRGVLLGVGLAGVGGVLAACSTAPVPYDADEAGKAPGVQAGQAVSQDTMAAPAGASAAASAEASAAESGMAGGVTGTVLGSASQIPVGGGKVFTAGNVVVTQPAAGQYKAFSAVCTHVGCICNVVANGTINCPCHGSKFKITDGSVVTGPASGPLPAKTIAVTDGKIMLQ